MTATTTGAGSTVAPAPLDVQSLREREFPFVGKAPFLNAASYTPLPERARRVLDDFNLRRAAAHDMRGDDFEPALARARRAAARLVGADEDEVALLPNTSFGINLAAQCLPLEPGRRVVVSDKEFPANVYPWMQLERSAGVRVDVVPADPLGRPDEARILEELDRGDVGVFALSAVQFATGWRSELARFGRFCRERGIFFVVDAIQALGCVPVDVREAEVDVLAAGCQKWLCSPWGTGFAYVRRELLPRMEPRVVGWTAMTASADYAAVTDYRYELWNTARRFEVATPGYGDFAAMAESVGLLNETGPDRIRAHVLGLLDPLAAWLQAEDVAEVVSDLRPEHRSGVFAFRPRDAERAFKALWRAGVNCVLREGSIRISPHLYNDQEDVARVMDVLAGRDGW